MASPTPSSAMNTTGTNGVNGTSGGVPSLPPPPRRNLEMPILSRQKPPAQEQEEADLVNTLGEFDGVPTLSHSECRLIIETVTDNRKVAAGGRRPDETDTMSKTREWLDKFARFKTREATMAVDRLLGGYGTRLDGFERSQIATLCPSDGDEAFTLIPSLKPKFTTMEMDELTRQVADLRTFE